VVSNPTREEALQVAVAEVLRRHGRRLAGARHAGDAAAANRALGFLAKRFELRDVAAQAVHLKSRFCNQDSPDISDDVFNVMRKTHFLPDIGSTVETGRLQAIWHSGCNMYDILREIV
jgi:hypothetical protein